MKDENFNLYIADAGQSKYLLFVFTRIKRLLIRVKYIKI